LNTTIFGAAWRCTPDFPRPAASAGCSMLPKTFYDYKIIVEFLCNRLGAVHDASPQAKFKQTRAPVNLRPAFFDP
jgi:hypothetical protein